MVRFGIIPELIGRLPIVTTLNPLDEKALVKILTEPKNAIVKQYIAMLEMDGIKLNITKDSSIDTNVGEVTISKTNDIFIDAETDVGKAKIEENNNKSQITLLIGNHFGDITNLVDYYLPKAAIDKISDRRTTILEKRGIEESDKDE